MTREEAKDYIREWCPYDRQEEIIEALETEPCNANSVIDVMIEWLKDKDFIKTNYQEKRAREELIDYMGQEPKTDILDKIRAEIDQAFCKVENDYDCGRNYGLYMATQIIDKYRQEG